MSFDRRVLELYRRLQYAITGRSRYGVMNPGSEVKIEPFRYEENHGDIVHPCVRFIPEGFEGHHWWMVYTPYYGADSSMENPILCFSDESNPSIPPTKWKVYGMVNGKLEEGYNSDPSLLFINGQLYVFWRENYEWSDKPHRYVRATFIAKVNNGSFEKEEKAILFTTDREVDAETCPTFMLGEDGCVTAYAMHLKFHSKMIQGMRPWLKSIADKMVTFADLLGVYSQQRHFGIAIWNQQGEITNPFIYSQTTKILKCNKLYRPWHMDLFDWQGKRYAIIQTNQMNADLCLAVSEDKVHFSMYLKPLITNSTIGKLGIYKPCALVTPKGEFYLYYTAQDPDDRKLNKLYLTGMDFNELLAKIS
jgi:hypothetical protein